MSRSGRKQAKVQASKKQVVIRAACGVWWEGAIFRAVGNSSCKFSTPSTLLADRTVKTQGLFQQ
ncbi:MAG: hypothetical protein DYG96_13390 [Chlorobi bacterium CHB2]|nr:hypothetical protein [Chlorobi bacterium CHB2]